PDGALEDRRQPGLYLRPIGIAYIRRLGLERSHALLRQLRSPSNIVRLPLEEHKDRKRAVVLRIDLQQAVRCVLQLLDIAGLLVCLEQRPKRIFLYDTIGILLDETLECGGLLGR